MSVKVPSTGTLSQKKLNGIYWKTFVGFVNRDDHQSTERNLASEGPKIHRRVGSFEYMELTTRDCASLQSESESCCSSTENSLSDSTKDEKSSNMYAILDMNRKREIQISDEIAIFDGSPIKRPGIHKDEAIFSDKDDVPFEEDSFDRLESTSPSMEPAPWKDQCLSIQRWMVPHILPDNEDEFVTLPDVVPMAEFEFCHYVPTLEAIMEESEESSDIRDHSPGYSLAKSASCSDNTELLKDHELEAWNSATDFMSPVESQDDLFSITSTYGSLGSMRRIGTFENLSLDAEDDHSGEETDGSSDELDGICDDIIIHGDADDVAHETNDKFTNREHDGNHEQNNELSTELFPEGDRTLEADEFIFADNNAQERLLKTEFLTVSNTNATNDLSSDVSSAGRSETSREVLAATSTQSLLESELLSSGRGSPTHEYTADQSDNEITETQTSSPGKIAHARQDSGVDDVTSEPANEIVSEDSKMDYFQYQDEINIPGLPDELYIDREDIPKIVVMFAQQELEKERRAQLALLEQEEIGANDDNHDGDMVQYRKRSSTGESVQDSAYSSREGVQKRMSHLKVNEASRLSTLSSSTPELSVMPDEELLYIPVSYASEAAAKKKKKRRATMSTAEAARRKAAILQTKALISGTGLGNGFNSLRKRLKSRKTAGTPLRRSQSEKPQLSYSSPDVSSPMARFLHSPLRRSKPKSNHHDDSPAPKIEVEGRRRGFRSVVTNIFRRLSSRFTSQNPSHNRDVISGHKDVIEQKSPDKSSLGVVKEESSASESTSIYSSARGSVVTPITMDKYVGQSPARRVSITALDGLDVRRKNSDFRERSFSVPVRPLSKSPGSKYASIESDVFESIQSHSSADDSLDLDKTIYV